MEKMAAPDSGPCSSNSNSQLCSQEPSSSGNVIGVDSDQPSDQLSKPSGAVVSLLDKLKSPTVYFCPSWIALGTCSKRMHTV